MAIISCITLGYRCLTVLQFSLELLLRFPSQVSDQPLCGEGILGRHPITHDGIQEGLPLPRVEAQNLQQHKNKQDLKPGL